MGFDLGLPVLVVWLVVLAIASQLLIRLAGKPKESTYAIRSPFLTAAERSFYGVLLSVIDDSKIVFCKVRVADVLKPSGANNRSTRQAAFNKISSKHFDFVVCRRDDLTVLGAIELNDKSHNSQKRRRRDQFLEKACESSGLPLVLVRAQRTYVKSDLEGVNKTV